MLTAQPSTRLLTVLASRTKIDCQSSFMSPRKARLSASGLSFVSVFGGPGCVALEEEGARRADDASTGQYPRIQSLRTLDLMLLRWLPEVNTG